MKQLDNSQVNVVSMDIKNLIEDINAFKRQSFAVGNSHLKTDIEDKSTKDEVSSKML